MLDNYISDICYLLNIEKPAISFDVSNFDSNTMMAQYRRNTVFIRKKDKLDPDYLYAIAHELRHMWQEKNNEELYFSNHKSVRELGVDGYNNQIVEIDANAFASIIMINIFHIKPLYNGLSDFTINMIKNRIKEIGDIND